jgi:hypothetical protein
MSRSTKTNRARPIQLDFKSVQQVIVTAEDGDRWVTTVKEAAAACQSALSDQEWKKEVEGFVARIHEWSNEHADVVAAAFIGISSEGLTGVIVTKGPEYRTEFDDTVTQLDIELANRFPHVSHLSDLHSYMGSKSDHQEKANHNNDFLKSIDRKQEYHCLHIIDCHCVI